jgi:hypothetical protein
MSAVKVHICRPCAMRLRQVLLTDGERSMAEAMADMLCGECMQRASQAVGHGGDPVRFELKRSA